MTSAATGSTLAERLDWCEPADAAARLRPLGGLCFLDSAARHPDLGRYSYVAADPFGRFEAREGQAFWNGGRLERSVPDALRACLARYERPRDPALPPFAGGAVGFLAYEFGRCFEPVDLPPEGPFGAVPEAVLLFYDTVVAFDHERGEAFAISSGPSARERIARFRQALRDPVPAERGFAPIPRERWRSNFTRHAFEAAVARTVEAVLSGEIFQANIAQRFLADMPDGFDPWAFYRVLRTVNSAPFAAYLDHGARVVASSSPELFLTLDERRVETRPIKGTARRQLDDPAADREAADRLLASQKDRAENLMIVDLLRNDLSRVCEPHSVEAPRLCALESHAGVHHLVSTVTGRMRGGLDGVDLLAASFPGGSVTGAPKLQAMKVIARTEREQRGLFCGSIAAFGFDGFVTGSIAIRTVLFQNKQAVLHAGGGITALSDPAAEYRETLAKAERVFQAFERGGEGAG